MLKKTNLGVVIPAGISIEKFDMIVANKFNLWNYPADEEEIIIDNKSRTVQVQFNDGTIRLVEIPDNWGVETTI